MTVTHEPETCGNEDCVICYPMITRTGHVVTPEELEAWADEAEAGYDIDKIRELL